MIRRVTLVLLVLGLMGLVFSATAKPAKYSDPLKRRAFFGMGSAELPDSMKSRIAPEKDGVLIIAIVKGRSAEKLGLQKGDVLLRLNGSPLHSSGDVRKVVYNYKAGDKVTAEYWHNGKVVTSSAALTEYPKESSPDFDIVYDSFKDGDSLRRVIITKPKAAGKYPVIVLLPGVGAFDIDRNKDVYEYPLQERLYSLTKAGFVTVRMDKPGQGDSQGPATDSLDYFGEIQFLLTGCKALTKWGYMDTTQVILLADGSGGYHAPLVTQEYPVKAVIALNTPGIGWREWDLNWHRREWTLGGVAPDSIESYLSSLDRGLNFTAYGDLAAVKDVSDRGAARGLPVGLRRNYIGQIVRMNMPSIWKRVTVPVFVVGGTSDYECSVDESRALADVVNYYHPGLATFLEMKDLDHELRTMPSWKASYDQTNKLAWFGPAHPELAAKVVDWAKKTVGK